MGAAAKKKKLVNAEDAEEAYWRAWFWDQAEEALDELVVRLLVDEAPHNLREAAVVVAEHLAHAVHFGSRERSGEVRSARGSENLQQPLLGGPNAAGTLRLVVADTERRHRRVE